MPLTLAAAYQFMRAFSVGRRKAMPGLVGAKAGFSENLTRDHYRWHTVLRQQVKQHFV